MNQVTFSYALLGLLGVLVVCALCYGMLLMHAHQLKPRKNRTGDWVAEVWLEWEVCRGSTMYRQRFRFRWTAYLAVRLRAILLDGVLPRFYRDTDWGGRPKMYEYEYGIHYGVRKLVEGEGREFHAIWSDVLPGHRDHSGEHASAHPFERLKNELSGSTLGYKL